MVNNVVLVGRLVKDPELKQAGETPICSFVLAVDRNYKNSEGERCTFSIYGCIEKTGQNMC